MKRQLLSMFVLVILALLGQYIVNAQVPPVFAHPVTLDTSSYRKFDSIVQVNGANTFHVGDDYYNSDLKVLASSCGDVVDRIPLGGGDHGFGNVIILRHVFANITVYTVYGHLASFADGTEIGRHIQ